MYRHEIWQAVKEENRAAAEATRGHQPRHPAIYDSPSHAERRSFTNVSSDSEQHRGVQRPPAARRTRRRSCRSRWSASLRLPDQPRRRRRSRTRDHREAARRRSAASARPSATPRTRSRSCRRRKARMAEVHIDAPARPRPRRAVQQRHALGERQDVDPSEVTQLCAEIARIGSDTKFNGITLLTGTAADHLPGRRRRRPDDHRLRRAPVRRRRRLLVDSAIFTLRDTSTLASIDAGRSRTSPTARATFGAVAEPARAHDQQPRHLRGEPHRRPRAGSATSTWRPRWSTSRSSRSSSRPAPRCSPRRTSPADRAQAAPRLVPAESHVHGPSSPIAGTGGPSSHLGPLARLYP